MGTPPKPPNTPPAAGGEAGSVARSQPADRNHRVVRAIDLTEEEIAAIEASEMEPGFEHLNAELEG